MAKGYYSIIQYCPDPSRLETVNVGVALFCPELRFLRATFKRRRNRISQVFGKQDWEFIALQQTAIAERLARKKESFQTLEDFKAYVSSRANSLVLTHPRPVRVEDPDRDLNDLVGRLVADPAQRRAL